MNQRSTRWIRPPLVIVVLMLCWWSSRGMNSSFVVEQPQRPEAEPRAPSSDVGVPCIGIVDINFSDVTGEDPPGRIPFDLAGASTYTLLSDASGVLRSLELPCGEMELTLQTTEWELLPKYSARLWVGSGPQEFQLELVRRCDGLVRVREASGAAVEGSLRSEVGPDVEEVPLDSGQAWMYRFCGLNGFTYEDPLGHKLSGLRLTVRDDSPEELVLPDIASATVQLVLDDDVPREATLRSRSVDIVEVQPGVFQVRGRRHQVGAQATADGRRAQLSIPLDGRTHVYDLAGAGRLHEVVVDCAPEACPNLECGLESCHLQSGAWICRCGPDASTLRVMAARQTPIVVGLADRWTESLSVTWPPSKVVAHARWTGELPCSWSLEPDDLELQSFLGPLRLGTCGPDGVIEVEVNPGSWRLVVQASSAESGALNFHVDESDNVLSLGLVVPEESAVEGSLDLPFPLEDAWLEVEPAGVVSLSSDGAVLVEGVPEGSSVTLIAVSPLWGIYSATLMLEAGFHVRLQPRGQTPTRSSDPP